MAHNPSLPVTQPLQMFLCKELGGRLSFHPTFFFLIFIVIQLQLYAFSPCPSTPPHPSRTHPTFLILVTC